MVNNGVTGPMDNVTLSFYKNGNWLQMFYLSKVFNDFLIVYSMSWFRSVSSMNSCSIQFFFSSGREGHQTDSVEEGMEELYKKRAVCLGLSTEPSFEYGKHSGQKLYTTFYNILQMGTMFVIAFVCVAELCLPWSPQIKA